MAAKRRWRWAEERNDVRAVGQASLPVSWKAELGCLAAPAQRACDIALCCVVSSVMGRLTSCLFRRGQGLGSAWELAGGQEKKKVRRGSCGRFIRAERLRS